MLLSTNFFLRSSADFLPENDDCSSASNSLSFSASTGVFSSTGFLSSTGVFSSTRVFFTEGGGATDRRVDSKVGEPNSPDSTFSSSMYKALGACHVYLCRSFVVGQLQAAWLTAAVPVIV